MDSLSGFMEGADSEGWTIPARIEPQKGDPEFRPCERKIYGTRRTKYVMSRVASLEKFALL